MMSEVKHKLSGRFLIVALIIAIIMLGLAGQQSLGAVNLTGKNIFINQAGYLPESLKRVVCDRLATKFTIITDESGKVVFTGNLSPIFDITSKKKIWTGNFSRFSQPGIYRIKIAGIGSSYPFSIDNNVYNRVFDTAMRAYYLQRCGIRLNDAETGLAHPICHKNDGVISHKDNFYNAGTQLNCMGGWHDAGDYGKYVPTTTLAAAYMLIAYELWPEKFTDGQFRIPESGNGVPDILDEARYGLDWLLTMQRPDGAVYHKIAGSRWITFVTPDNEYQTRYVYGISTADTGKFAATMAIATRVWQKRDPEFANRTSQAASKAWEFLQNNGFVWDHTNFDDEGSGAYSMTDDTADRLWAAMELSTLVTENQPIKELVGRLNSYKAVTVSWENPATLGLFDYSRSENALPEIKAITIRKLTGLAEKNLQAALASGYRYTLKFSEFAWASNKEGLSRGITMLFADQIQAKPNYRRNALAQLDFVLGLNPLSKCFVSGIGSNPSNNLHHRLAVATGKIVPGLMAGGPNNKAESGAEIPGKGPYSYQDGTQSFSSNEPAIDYNAALIFLSAAFAAKPN